MAFIDMRMPPGWDGVETVERLWQEDPRLQIVFCTAYSDYSWKEVLPRLDVRDRLLILKKPFDPIEVYQFANALTTKWQMTEQAAFKMESLEQAVEERTRELSNANIIVQNSPVDPLSAARRALLPAHLYLAQHHQAGSRSEDLAGRIQLGAAAHLPRGSGQGRARRWRRILNKDAAGGLD